MNIEPTDEQIETFRAAWLAADGRKEQGGRIRAGLRAVLALTPTREQVLLALARADGQPWGSIAEATPHTAEMMYGKQADAVLALLPEAPTVALDVETVRAALAPSAGVVSVEQIAAVVLAADPRRTEAQVKAEALREAADEIDAGPTYIPLPVHIVTTLIRETAARIEAGQ